MSAAGRGAKRAPYDYYPTPEWAVEALAANMGTDAAMPHLLKWGEPCAGDGAIIRAMWRAQRVEPRQWEWAEIREGLDYLGGDNFERQPVTEGSRITLRQVDAIITNPPFSIAREFVEQSQKEADFVAYLLRLNFLGGQCRREFWQDNAPTHLYPLSKRPSFTGKGTDATDYAWFVWDRLGLMRQAPGIYVL
jgi:hypothetical protein